MREKITNDARNGYIELIRLVLAYLIAAMHFNGSIPGGYLGLEIFFMLSGFYQMQKMQQSSPESFAPFKYTLTRFLKLFFIYESSILLLALFGENGLDPALFVRRMFICLPDMLCLQMTGLYHVSINPELWYVSAMITSGFFLALLFCASPRIFRLSLPAITILGYAFLYSHYGTLEINHSVRDFALPSGTIRGLSGMSAGCWLYFANEHIKQIENSRKKSAVLSMIFIITAAITALCIFFKAKSAYDYYLVFSSAVMLLCALSGETLLSPYMNRLGQAINAVLGKQFSFGLVCYTAVTIVASAGVIPYGELSPNSGLLVFLALLSVISFVGAKLAEVFNRKLITGFIKNIILIRS